MPWGYVEKNKISMTTTFCNKCDDEVETQIQLSSPGKVHHGKLICNQLHFIEWAHTPETSERWRQQKNLLTQVLSQEKQLMKFTAYEKDLRRI